MVTIRIGRDWLTASGNDGKPGLLRFGFSFVFRKLFSKRVFIDLARKLLKKYIIFGGIRFLKDCQITFGSYAISAVGIVIALMRDFACGTIPRDHPHGACIPQPPGGHPWKPNRWIRSHEWGPNIFPLRHSSIFLSVTA